MLRHLKFSQKLYGGFGIIILIMLSILSYTYLNYRNESKVVDDNLYTYQVIREADGILTSLLNMETGARGYALAGEEEFLKPYQQGKIDYEQHYANLSRLISGDPLQMDRLNSLQALYADWFEWETTQIIGSREKVNQGQAQISDVIALVQLGKGKAEMDGIRSLLNQIIQEQEQLLDARNENLEKAQTNTALVMTTGGAASIALALLISIFAALSVSKPIKALISATASITAENYQEPIHLKTDAELETLILHFNQMQAAIREREEELKKKNEALRVEMLKANEATKLKSQFLANMSHELRTPLNSIIGFTGRVLKKSGDSLPPVQKENLMIVNEEALHLLDLINSLLDYSKIEAGKMEIHLESFNLLKVIDEVYQMTRTLADNKPIHYMQSPPATDTLMIYSDRMKVKQILINLLSNAFKYSDQGTISLTAEHQQPYYRVAVKDEGIGIAPEHITSIFDEFRQIDGSYTRKVGGTGLGLSITKQLVEMLGGTIDVESIPGKGSCFTILLPIETAGSLPNQPRSSPSQSENRTRRLNKRIICVDDDPNVQKLYQQYLSEQGFDTIPLTGEEDVLGRICELMPDVILLDIMLPHKDGWEILAELKDNTATKSIPVIMASVLSEEKLAYRMKADDYLIKPVSQEELLNAIVRTAFKMEGTDVLIADDDENFLTIIGQILTEQSIFCRFARDGEEALRQILWKRPDVLIMDIMMPKKDGFSLLEEIRTTKTIKDLPVIVVTAKDLTNSERDHLQKMANLCLHKSGTQIEQVMETLIKKLKEKGNGNFND